MARLTRLKKLNQEQNAFRYKTIRNAKNEDGKDEDVRCNKLKMKTKLQSLFIYSIIIIVCLISPSIRSHDLFNHHLLLSFDLIICLISSLTTKLI